MPTTVISRKPSTGRTDGSWHILHNSAPAQVIQLPLGVSATSTMPCYDNLNFSGRSRQYVVGGHTDNLVFDEHYRIMRQGILPPLARPTLAAGAGVGITGSCTGYISFYDAVGVRRSPLSAGTSPVALVNKNRSWTALPTFCPDDEAQLTGTSTVNASATVVGVGTRFTSQLKVGDRISVSSLYTTFRTVIVITDDTHLTLNGTLGDGTLQQLLVHRPSGVTHVELWVSMDGGLPRLVARVDLGLSTWTENIATLALGEAFTLTFSKFPRCTVNKMYHQRQWMCGDAQYPNRIYYSLINSPEDMEGYLETRTGGAAIALFVVRDQLYVGCPDNIERLQGFTASDFEVSIAEPQIGVINNASIKVIHGYAIIPSHTQWYLCSGAFSPISGAYSKLWANEYKTNRAAYEASFAADLRDDNVYQLFIGGAMAIVDRELTEAGQGSVQSISYVLDYSTLIPQAGGTFAPPELDIDVRARKYDFAFQAALPGSSRADTYLCGCNGVVYKQAEADSGTADDASDTYAKQITIKDGVRFLGDPGGDDTDGKEFKSYWIYVTSETKEWLLQVRHGDEGCDVLTDQGFFEAEVAATFSNVFIDYGTYLDSTTKTPKNRHYFTPRNFNQGVGIQYKITCVAPTTGWAFSGWGATYGPGGNPRGAVHIISQVGV